MKKSTKVALWIIFIAYCAVMLYMLFSRTASETRNYNLVPFKTIGEFWTVLRQSAGVEYAEALFMFSLANLLGNVLLFSPLGFFPALLRKKQKSARGVFVFCAVAVIAVELAQYATGLGSADIDDFILNMLGAAIGWGLYALGSRILRRGE